MNGGGCIVITMNNNIEICDADESSSIGRELAKLRVQLNMTQQQFAEAVFTSRMTINRVERTSRITPDFAYRIYYATDKVIGNVYIPEPIRQHAKCIQKRVEKEIILAETVDEYNPLIYTTDERNTYT